MPGLNPSIVEHHIDTWPGSTPVHKKQQPLHPSKVATIKAEIDKLRAVEFIYPIAYTSWVSNPVLSLCNFLEVEKEEIHKGNLNQPL
jgi:hypothetical protein